LMVLSGIALFVALTPAHVRGNASLVDGQHVAEGALE
jgi:hypothetical protein